MAQPTLNDVHVDAILTNISIAYMQDRDNFIADKVFPVIPVDKKSDKFFTYTKNDWFRDEAQRRAPATESAGGGYNLSTDTYSADIWAFHKDVPDQIVANADAPLNPLREAAEFVTHRLLLRRELQFVTDFMSAGVWGTTIAGTAGTATSGQTATQWSNYTSSDPIEDVDMRVRELVVRSRIRKLKLDAIEGAEARKWWRRTRRRLLGRRRRGRHRRLTAAAALALAVGAGANRLR
jgi:hypothetical protein